MVCLNKRFFFRWFVCHCKQSLAPPGAAVKNIAAVAHQQPPPYPSLAMDQGQKQWFMQNI